MSVPSITTCKERVAVRSTLRRKQSYLNTIIETNDSGLPRAVRAAVDLAISFNPVADDSAATVSATWREGMDRALETVEHMHLALRLYLEALVIGISADFTFCHGFLWFFAKFHRISHSSASQAFQQLIRAHEKTACPDKAKLWNYVAWATSNQSIVQAGMGLRFAQGQPAAHFVAARTALSNPLRLNADADIINQPIFSSRKVTTSVSVWDGQTVVLGGLMREDVQKTEDRTPILGDIPIVGRLFRTNAEQHLKRNLVIFVTARLINPGGQLVNQTEEEEETEELILPPELPPIPMYKK